MKCYVVGFLYSNIKDAPHVLLVNKLKPEWQAGYWNGIGGKVESGESPEQAMSREFKEETGISVSPKEWKHMVTLVCPGGTVFFFRAVAKTHIFCGNFPRANDTGEEIDWKNAYILPIDTITNLRWLVPFCLLQKLEHPIFVHEDMSDYAWQTPGKEKEDG